MNFDFSIPQYQSKKGILLLTIISFGKFLRNFWFIIIYFFYKNGFNSLLYFVLTFIAATIIIVFLSYFKYYYFTYQIDYENDEFIIKSGIINKKTIILERKKIQEANVNQPFFHRLLNIYQLELDSPGSDKNEISINAISFANAKYLQDYLLQNRLEESKVLIEENAEIQTLKISVFSIIKYAISANYFNSFIAIIGVFFYISQNIPDNLLRNLFDFVESKATEQNLDFLSIFTYFFIILILVFLGIFANVVRTVILYYGLKISKFQDYFSLEYGFFTTKNQIVNKKKVQITITTQNYFQKLTNILQLKFNQIGEDHTKINSNSIPGCNSNEKDDILKFLYGKVPNFQFSIKPNFRFLISRGFILIIIPNLITYFLPWSITLVFPIAIIYSIFVSILIFFAYKNCSLFFNENFVKKQEGIWDVDIKTIEIEKIQAVKISQYFWQKKSGIGSIDFSTAGGNVSMSASKISDLKQLMNYVLFKIESSSKNWL